MTEEKRAEIIADIRRMIPDLARKNNVKNESIENVLTLIFKYNSYKI